ncbi:hypothetical protein QFZ72_000339 [Bacillus sp. V2I10]|nr:hypothetical protein [Bacillus sp. V2I10]
MSSFFYLLFLLMLSGCEKKGIRRISVQLRQATQMVILIKINFFPPLLSPPDSMKLKKREKELYPLEKQLF